MQTKIDALKAASQSLREALLALESLNKKELELKAGREKLQAQLANVPVESLALPASDDKSFDRTTTRMLASRLDIATKLDLLPGIRVRYEAESQGLRQQVRVAVKALTRHCRELAIAKMENQQAELATILLPLHGGDADRAKAAAAKGMEGCDAWNWQESFRCHTHATDPLEDAESVIALSESFSRGEPCN